VSASLRRRAHARARGAGVDEAIADLPIRTLLVATRPPLRVPVARDLRLDSRAFGIGQRPVARPVGGDVGLLVRGAAVIALAEVLDHEFPVALIRNGPARGDFQVRRLVLLQRGREIPDPRVEVRRVVREGDEDEAAQHLQGHGVQPIL
jgi:hypothetical protein